MNTLRSTEQLLIIFGLLAPALLSGCPQSKEAVADSDAATACMDCPDCVTCGPEGEHSCREYCSRPVTLKDAGTTAQPGRSSEPILTGDASVAIDPRGICNEVVPTGMVGATGVDCGYCEVPLTRYCEARTCEMPAELTCRSGILNSVVEAGCGYLRMSLRGDVGDHWGYVWEADTGKPVYVWHNGVQSFACHPSITAGEEPECDDWQEACN